MICDVYYTDAVRGGSGSTRVELSELPEWLAARTGTLVREIVPLECSLNDSKAYKDVRRAGEIGLAEYLKYKA